MNQTQNTETLAFSPDGKKIAFYYQKDKTDKSSHEELFVMNDDGTGMTRLTHYPENNPSQKTMVTELVPRNGIRLKIL